MHGHFSFFFKHLGAAINALTGRLFKDGLIVLAYELSGLGL